MSEEIPIEEIDFRKDKESEIEEEYLKNKKISIPYAVAVAVARDYCSQSKNLRKDNSRVR